MKSNIQNIILAAATVLVATITSAAYAAPSDKSSIQTKAGFQKIDTNGDGKISRQEAASHNGLAKYFDQIDTDKDGYLSREELKAHHAKKVMAKFNAIDKDHDGRISRAEADAKAPQIAKNFDRLDKNKDGYLSQDELLAERKMRGQ